MLSCSCLCFCSLHCTGRRVDGGSDGSEIGDRSVSRLPDRAYAPPAVKNHSPVFLSMCELSYGLKEKRRCMN